MLKSKPKPTNAFDAQQKKTKTTTASRRPLLLNRRPKHHPPTIKSRQLHTSATRTISTIPKPLLTNDTMFGNSRHHTTTTTLATATSSSSTTPVLTRCSITTSVPSPHGNNINLLHHQSFQFRSSFLTTTIPKKSHRRNNKGQIAPYQQQFGTMATSSSDQTADSKDDKPIDQGQDPKALLAAAQKKNHEAFAIAQQKKDELKKFWSTNTPERTTKFKSIVLQREIGLDDFQAIFSNSILVQKDSMDGPGIEVGTSVDLTKIYFPWHLSLSNSLSSPTLIADPKYFGTISTKAMHYCIDKEEGAVKVESILDGNLFYKVVDWYDSWDCGKPDAQFSTYALNKLSIKLATDKNPSPIEKVDITTITKDNIDNIDGLLDKVNIYDLIPKGKTLSYLFSRSNIPDMWSDLKSFYWYDGSLLTTSKRKDIWAVVLALLANGQFTIRKMMNHDRTFSSIDNDIMEPNNNFEAVYDVETEEFRWDDVGAESGTPIVAGRRYGYHGW